MRPLPEIAPVHWTTLARIGMSPAHYQAALAEEMEDTYGMRIGRLTHTIVLGGPPSAVWEGTRRGKAWEEFKAAHEGHEIVTASENEAATRIARAVQACPIATSLLGGETEVPLEWTNDLGIRCATRGVDFIGDTFFGDLKTTRCSEPGRFNRDARFRCYHAQLANYRDGLRKVRGKDFEHAYIVAVESTPPYCVTTLHLGPRALEEGDRINRLWYERLRQCIEANEWPGYVQSVVEFMVGETAPELIVGGQPFDWGGEAA